MYLPIAAALLTVSVLALVILRPKGLDAAWPAGIGALIAVAFGLIPLSTVKTVFLSTWDASATLIALFILSETLECNRFFDWAALHLAHKSKGSGQALFVYVLLLTALTTALLANDGAVLMLTPIFSKMLQKIYPDSRKNWLPTLFAAGFFADAMSATFIPSNLTNIIIADAYRLSYVPVLTRMAIPMLLAFVVGTAAFGLRFRKSIRTPYSLTALGSPADVIRDWTVFRFGLAVLGLLVLGYAVGGRFHAPTAAVALPLAGLMLALVHHRRLSSARQVIAAAPWNILVYACGMFVVISAAYGAHLLSFITQPLSTYAAQSGARSLFITGGLAAVLSSALNNLPATLISVLALQKVAHVSPLALDAVILGVNIGPKLTPFGSLATLLWLGLLEKGGIQISWLEYLKENWWVTLLVLLAALAGLSISAALF